MSFSTKKAAESQPSTNDDEQTVASPSETRRAKEWFDAQVKKSRYTRFVVEGVKVTPALAEVLLGKNPDNRRIYFNVVEGYAADMKAGRWVLNGETIKVAKGGHLNDGQHRLAACIAAGVPFVCDFTFGLERESRLTVDQGVKRTVGNILQMDGVSDSNNLAVAGRIIGRLQKYGHIWMKNAPFTRSEVVEVVRSNPGLAESIAHARPLSHDRLGRIGMHTALHYLFAKKNRAKADEFYKKLATGEELRKSHPILTLRRKIVSEIMNEPAAMFYTIKAWNAFVKGKEMSAMRHSAREGMPEIEG